MEKDKTKSANVDLTSPIIRLFFYRLWSAKTNENAHKIQVAIQLQYRNKSMHVIMVFYMHYRFITDQSCCNNIFT